MKLIMENFRGFLKEEISEAYPGQPTFSLAQCLEGENLTEDEYNNIRMRAEQPESGFVEEFGGSCAYVNSVLNWWKSQRNSADADKQPLQER